MAWRGNPVVCLLRAAITSERVVPQASLFCCRPSARYNLHSTLGCRDQPGYSIRKLRMHMSAAASQQRRNEKRGVDHSARLGMNALELHFYLDGRRAGGAPAFDEHGSVASSIEAGLAFGLRAPIRSSLGHSSQSGGIGSSLGARAKRRGRPQITEEPGEQNGERCPDAARYDDQGSSIRIVV